MIRREHTVYAMLLSSISETLSKILTTEKCHLLKPIINLFSVVRRSEKAQA